MHCSLCHYFFISRVNKFFHLVASFSLSCVSYRFFFFFCAFSSVSSQVAYSLSASRSYLIHCTYNFSIWSKSLSLSLSLSYTFPFFLYLYFSLKLRYIFAAETQSDAFISQIFVRPYDNRHVYCMVYIYLFYVIIL